MNQINVGGLGVAGSIILLILMFTGKIVYMGIFIVIVIIIFLIPTKKDDEKSSSKEIKKKDDDYFTFG